MRLILHRTVGADIAPSGPARWGAVACYRYADPMGLKNQAAIESC
jgi:hypothetical protein